MTLDPRKIWRQKVVSSFQALLLTSFENVQNRLQCLRRATDDCELLDLCYTSYELLEFRQSASWLQHSNANSVPPVVQSRNISKEMMLLDDRLWNDSEFVTQVSNSAVFLDPKITHCEKYLRVHKGPKERLLLDSISKFSGSVAARPGTIVPPVCTRIQTHLSSEMATLWRFQK